MLCPLHTDGTPSFKVNPARQQFFCFGCGAKGDVFDFLEQAERLDKGQAIERLRELAGGAAPDPAAVAAQAARRAAAAAQEAQEAAQRTALARRIWSEAEYLTRRSDPLAGGLSDRAARHPAMGHLRAALAPALPMGERAPPAASSRRSRTPPAT